MFINIAYSEKNVGSRVRIRALISSLVYGSSIAEAMNSRIRNTWVYNVLLFFKLMLVEKVQVEKLSTIPEIYQ